MPHTLADLSGPREIPFLGSLTHMAEDPLAFVTRLNREHGGCVPFRIGPQQTILLTEPSLIEELLIKHRAACIKDPVTAGLSDLLGNGLLTAEGERWRRNRRLMAPNFQHRHLASLAATMVASTDTALSEVTAGELDVHDHMMDLTLDIATRTLFGTVLDDAARVGPLLEELMECFETEVRSWRRLLPRWVPTPLRRRTHANRAQLHEILGVIVSRKRAELQALPLDAEAPSDLLTRLILTRDEDGKGMDDAQLGDEVLTLFLAGHETTALAISYALWLLATHPEVQSAARAEVDSVLGDRLPDAADSQRLPTIDAVFQETMRLYPPAWMIGRQLVDDIVLGDLAVPAGTVFLIPQWVVHRDPRWFDEPDTFQPSRWPQPADRPRFAFFPFGGGPRVCIGNHFARMESILVLARWVQHFWLAPVRGFAPDLAPSVTLRPRNGIQISVQPHR